MGSNSEGHSNTPSSDQSNHLDRAAKETLRHSLNPDAAGGTTPCSPTVHQETAGDQRDFFPSNSSLQFLYRASVVTSRADDIAKMFAELMELVVDWIDAANSYVLLKQENEPEYSVQFSRRGSNAQGDPESQPCQAIVNFVHESKTGVHSPHPLKDARWRIAADENASHIRDVICIPIQGRGDILGIVYVDLLSSAPSDEEFKFSEDHLRLVEAMAGQAALAMEKIACHEMLMEKEPMAVVGETAILVTHRINNILQGMMSASHLIGKGIANEDLKVAKKGSEIASLNQDKMTDLLKGLLALGKPFEPAKQPANIAQILANARLELADLFSSNELQYRESQHQESKIEPGEEEPKIVVDCDPDSLKFVFENLFRIVFKATEEESDRSLNVLFHNEPNNEHDATEIRFEYRGAEICLDPKAIDEPETEHNSRIIGGVEFAASRKIVRGHGGEIEVSKIANGLNRIAVLLPRTGVQSY